MWTWVIGGRRLMLKAKYRLGLANDRVRTRLRAGDPRLQLDQVQRRLELLLNAVYGRTIPIAPVDDDLWTRERVRRIARRDPRAREAIPSVDGDTIYLPAALTAGAGFDEAIARYRLMAIEQAERIARGTALIAPLEDPLERDLYLLREGAAVDAAIARNHPGIAELLTAERAAAMARRPKLDALTTSEREVESLVRETLAAPPDRAEAASESSAASLDWARTTARQIRRDGEQYRGVPQTSFWGNVHRGTVQLPRPTDVASHSISTGNTDSQYAESKRGKATEGFDQARGEQPDPAGTPDKSEAGAREDGDEIQRVPDTKPARGEAGRTGSSVGAEMSDIIHGGPPEDLPPAIYYDEWNAGRGAYVKRGAAVRLYPSDEGEAAWARQILGQHAATVRQVRQQFERLRARRMLLSRQRSGNDLDIAACVSAVVDRRIGEAADDRLYLDARPARRGLAISLLVDTSGSTDARVTKEWRIIDLEKIALLLATQALDALGDLYAVSAFAGRGAENVKLTTIKDFSERSGDVVNRRIAALESGGFTRLGAAVRHASRQLVRQAAGHRLLLLLSDGRPNDVDTYQGDHGVEDSRQAIFEARASGVYPFCLTVDADASEYLPRIFGRAGHTILQKPQQLPNALLGVVRALIRRQS